MKQYHAPTPPSLLDTIYRTIWCAVVVGGIIYALGKVHAFHDNDNPAKCSECLGKP